MPTRIDIDPEALDEAMRLSGVSTEEEAVDIALRAYVARHRRPDALEYFAVLAREWDFAYWERRRAREKDIAE